MADLTAGFGNMNLNGGNNNGLSNNNGMMNLNMGGNMNNNSGMNNGMMNLNMGGNMNQMNNNMGMGMNQMNNNMGMGMNQMNNNLGMNQMNTQQNNNQQFGGFQGANTNTSGSQNLITFHKKEVKADMEFGDFEKAQTVQESEAYANFTKDEAALFDLSGMKSEKKKEESKPQQNTMYGAMNMGGGFNNMNNMGSNNNMGGGFNLL